MNNLYIMVTGGGSTFISDLIKRGGVSSFFIGAEIPYNMSELNERIPNISFKKTPCVSKEVCNAMLDYCDNKLSKYKNNRISIVCTAKLKTEGERKDRKHEAFIGISFSGSQEIYKIEFRDRKGTRISQEYLLNDIITKIWRVVKKNEIITINDLNNYVLLTGANITYA